MLKVCTDCGKAEAVSGPRCLECFRAVRKLQARALRGKKRKKLLENSKLVPIGNKICSRCFRQKKLCEFSRRHGEQGRINDICDRCLSKLYVGRGIGMDYGFWRRKAYSCNSVERARRKRRELRNVRLEELDWICKPQDLLKLFEAQEGKCAYCSVELTASIIQIDHKIPLTRGGKHNFNNLALSCRDCNYLKHTRTASEFFKFVAAYVLRFKQ